jgi:Flp pilus assembly protein TadD
MTSLPSARASLRRRLLAGMVLAPIALTLGGCAGMATDPTTTSAIAKPVTQEDFNKALAYWGDKYKDKAKDKTVALNYAASLQRNGQAEQAIAVLQQAVAANPSDKELLAALGKAQAAGGDLQQALDTLHRADTGAPDWKLMSAEGAILDQLGRNDEARKLYADALEIQPNDPTILSNFAMSYVMTSDLKPAEKLLRKAIAQPSADSRVRQNLALVVGLQGRFDEAEKIAAAELSPDQAEANIAYLKQMLAQQNSWQALKAGISPTG